MSMRLEQTVKVGDLLTSLSIIVSFTIASVAWTKDRDLRQKEQADRVRAAAAKTCVKLDRWKDISLSLFDEAKPAYVDTKELLKKRFDITEARDLLWRNLHEAKIRTSRKALDDQIEIAYADLYGYHPSVREIFAKTLDQLRSAEELAFEDLLGKTEKIVLAWDGRKQEYETAKLWNELVDITKNISGPYEKKINEILSPIFQFLTNLTVKSDEELLRKPDLPSIAPEATLLKRGCQATFGGYI